MKEIKKNHTGMFFTLAMIIVVAFGGYKLFKNYQQNKGQSDEVINTDFGLFLAAQHALYINDFDTASAMINDIKSDKKIVNQIRNVSDFFNGKMPSNADSLKNSKELVDGMIYDAYLINQDDWKTLYNRHNKDESVLTALVRIFAGANQGKTKETIKFINSLPTTDSWKSFIRGQIAVLNNDIDGAAKEFAKVHPEFMNVNDYLYLMSFYKHFGMMEDVEILRNDFLAKLGGMYMVDYPDIPDWKNYSGYKNNLAFGIIQTISHTQFIMYTDLSLMFLRFAQIISDNPDTDAINYYLGQYYFNNYGDFKSHFKQIKKSNPLFLFAKLKTAEKDNDTKTIQKIANDNPLFIPAFYDAMHDNIQNGNRHSALRLINRALKQHGLSEAGRLYFLKQRVYVNLVFNHPKSAQRDLLKIQEIDEVWTPDMMLLQARTWEQLNQNLDQAYDYVMELIKMNKSDVNAWETLGLIVYKRENVENAIEILERVGEVAMTTSSLYEHLGDLYKKRGDKERAKRAYSQALDLSNDGLIVIPNVKKKLRKLK